MYIQCIPFQWAYPVRTLTLGKQFVTFNYFRQRRQRFKFNLIDMWFSVLHPPTPKKSCFCKEGNPPFLYIQCNCALHSCAVIVLVCLLRFNVTVLPERNKTNRELTPHYMTKEKVTYQCDQCYTISQLRPLQN